ncbi:RHS repeat-associated core domain-containing protein, partial [Bacillus sp. REN10]|uniref:RHS repeat-associated core domain-containing protein n=1 Tax=Bacillus sp. REN10 TaxID=2782541 RepID=UPI00193C2ED3
LSESGSMAGETPIRYKGYRYDIETGLYYLIARYYQPAEGVFLTVDPEGGDTNDPKTQNGYAYANNNPVMMTDPDGNCAWLVINAGFAAYSGYQAYKSGKGARGIAAAATFGFVGGGKGKAVKKGIGLVKKIHGNSRKSKKANRGYEIYKIVNGQKRVVKVGISGWKISKSGKSYRATKQADKWARKYGGTYHTRIVKRNMTRGKAEKWEQGHVNRIAKAGGRFPPRYHKKPLPW